MEVHVRLLVGDGLHGSGAFCTSDLDLNTQSKRNENIFYGSNLQCSVCVHPSCCLVN